MRERKICIFIFISQTGVKNKYEDEHLTSLLKHFMVLEPSSESELQIEEMTTEQLNLPYFEDLIDSINVTSQFGNTVTLHCRVHNLQDKVVSIILIEFYFV
ncbi:hypothetical protein PGB90_003591 [Kerria lacca]